MGLASDDRDAYRADNLAASLGLTLVSGDPGTNLLNARRDPAAPALVLRGTHEDRPIELAWRDGADGARLSMACTSGEPPFEVLNRERTPAMTPVPLLEAEAQPFGDPPLDATYALRGGSRGLGPRLVDAVRPSLRVDWIHLLWDGEHLSDVLHPYATFRPGQGEAVLETMAAVARTIDG